MEPPSSGLEPHVSVSVEFKRVLHPFRPAKRICLALLMQGSIESHGISPFVRRHPGLVHATNFELA